MGSRASKPEVKGPHFFFGEVSYKNEFNKQLITCYRDIRGTQDELRDWEAKRQQALHMKKDALLLAESFEREEIKKYWTCCECPADYQISITFEKFDYDYKSELVKRADKKQFYTEEQLFFILYNFLEGAKQFQVKGLKFGDIRPKNIIITKSSQLKMINVASFPWETTSIEKKLDALDNKTVFYFAPEELKFIQSVGGRAEYPNAKTEAFSIGLTLLEASILVDSQDLYVNNSSLNFKEIGKRLEVVKSRYPQLHHYLQLILFEKPEDRLSSGEAWACLKPYSERITEAKSFEINRKSENSSVESFRRSKQ